MTTPPKTAAGTAFDARELFINIHNRNLTVLNDAWSAALEKNKRVGAELRQFLTLDAAQADYVTCAPLPGTNYTQLLCSILGPAGTPYEAGVFHLVLVLPPKYPHNPPSVRFLTRIYHPNIDIEGNFYGDILDERQWSTVMTVYTVLITLAGIISAPSTKGVAGAPSEIQHTDIGDWDSFEKSAQRYTEQFATKDLPSVEEARAVADSMLLERAEEGVSGS